MMWSRIGRPPISTSGFGRNSVSSRNRVPCPPHRITVFTRAPPSSPAIGKRQRRQERRRQTQTLEEHPVLAPEQPEGARQHVDGGGTARRRHSVEPRSFEQQ